MGATTGVSRSRLWNDVGWKTANAAGRLLAMDGNPIGDNEE